MTFTEWEAKAEEHQRAVDAAHQKAKEAQDEQRKFLLETMGVDNHAEVTIKGVANMIAKVVEMKKA